MLPALIQEIQADPVRAALALTWGFVVFAAVVVFSEIKRRNSTILWLQAQLRGARLEGAKTQALPDWLVLRRSTSVGGGLAILPRFKLPSERAP